MAHIAGRYETGDAIGSGTMGDVFPATDTQADSIVAVKQLNPDEVICPFRKVRNQYAHRLYLNEILYPCRT